MAKINWEAVGAWGLIAFKKDIEILRKQLGAMNEEEIDKILSEKYKDFGLEDENGNKMDGYVQLKETLAKDGTRKNLENIDLAGGLNASILAKLTLGYRFPIQEALKQPNYFRAVKKLGDTYVALWRSKQDTFQVVIDGSDVSSGLQWWATEFFDPTADFYKSVAKMTFQLNTLKKNVDFKFETFIGELGGSKAFLMDEKTGKPIKEWADPSAWRENVEKYNKGKKKNKQISIRGVNLGVLSEAALVSPIFQKTVGSKLLNGADLYIMGSNPVEMFGIPFDTNIDIKATDAGIDFDKLSGQSAEVMIQTPEGVVLQPPIEWEPGKTVGVVAKKEAIRKEGKPSEDFTYRVKNAQMRNVEKAGKNLRTRSFRRKSTIKDLNYAWVLKGPDGWFQARDRARVPESEVFLFEEPVFYGPLQKLEFAYGAGAITLTKKDEKQLEIDKKTGNKKGKINEETGIRDFIYEASPEVTNYAEIEKKMLQLIGKDLQEIGAYSKYGTLLETVMGSK
jgi:hypothetical protein